MDYRERVDRLAGYGKVLNDELLRAEPFAMEREDELEVIRRQFQSERSRSFVLVGPSGSGKTAVIHEAARRLLERDPEWIVLQTSGAELLCGTKWLGELQTRVSGLIEAAKNDKVLLIFSDLHLLREAGRSSSSDISIATQLTPAIEAGELLVIGECTPENYRLGIENDSSIRKLFQPIKLDEPTDQQTWTMLAAVAEYRSRRLASQVLVNFTFPDETLRRIHELAKSYVPGQVRPGRSFTLLDQVLRSQAIEAEEEGLVGQDVTVGYDAVIRALARYTGMPIQLLDDSQTLDLAEVRRFFEARVLGQPEPVSAVVDLITLVKAGMTDPSKPMAVLLFVGPTGVGKTELAKALTEFIFGSADRMIRYDMSEFKDYHSFEKLIGDPKGRNEPLQAGSTLTARVRQQPFSVILLDEFEKANPNIFDLFLQVFADGRLTDALGQTVSFNQTVIVLTSNVGSDLEAPVSMGFQAKEESLIDGIQAGLEQSFRPEFLNRLDRIVFFQPLRREHMRRIADRELGRVLHRSGIQRRNIRLDIDPGLVDLVVLKGFSKRYGARPLKRAIEQYVMLPIARQIVQLTGDRGRLLQVAPAGDKVRIQVIEETPAAPEPKLVSVTVQDSEKGKVRLAPQEIKQEHQEAVKQIEALQAICAEQGIEAQMTDLIAATNDSAAWKNPVANREKQTQIHRIEEKLARLRAAERHAAETGRLIERAVRDKDMPTLTQAAQRLQELKREIALARYVLTCRGADDPCDAFVEVHLVGGDTEEDDSVRQIAEMYLNWAKAKNFDAMVLHESLAADDHTDKLVLLIEGYLAFGMLRHEEGIHQLVYGAASHRPRREKYVHVRVLPRTEGSEPALRDADLNVERRRARGKGLLVPHYRSHLVLFCDSSASSVEGRSGLAEKDAQPLLRDWLRAEMLRRQAGAERPEDPITAKPRRSYTLRPNQGVKDPLVKRRSGRLDQLWKGRLDEFLHIVEEG